MIIYIPVRKSVLARFGDSYADAIEDIKYEDYDSGDSDIPISEKDIREGILQKEKENRVPKYNSEEKT